MEKVTISNQKSEPISYVGIKNILDKPGVYISNHWKISRIIVMKSGDALVTETDTNYVAVAKVNMKEWLSHIFTKTDEEITLKFS